MSKHPIVKRIVDGALVTIAALAVVAFVYSVNNVHTLVTRASAPSAVAKDVGYAPGYDWDVTAAGYAVCGQLQRGATVDEVIASSVAFGIRGDLDRKSVV